MMLKLRAVAAASFLVLVGAACAAETTAPDSTATPHYGTWGFDLSGEDKAVKPGDDFFRFANGAYLARTEIPADRTRFGNFDALSVLSENRVHAILEEARAKPTAATAKIGAYYAAFMDEDRVEKLGAAPLQGELAKVRAATTRDALIAIMNDPRGMHRGVFGAGISPDAKDPGHYAVYVGSGGTSLPDRDYYLKPGFAEKKAAYQVYVAKMLTLIGWPEPDAPMSFVALA